MATGAIIASAIGTVASLGASQYAQHQQKKAARSAANEAARIADAAVARSADSAAAQQTNTEADSRSATQRAAKRRFSMASTVNRIGESGGRLTLN